jgi:hypothetical protein
MPERLALDPVQYIQARLETLVADAEREILLGTDKVEVSGMVLAAIMQSLRSEYYVDPKPTQTELDGIRHTMAVYADVYERLYNLGEKAEDCSGIILDDDCISEDIKERLKHVDEVLPVLSDGDRWDECPDCINAESTLDEYCLLGADIAYDQDELVFAQNHAENLLNVVTCSDDVNLLKPRVLLDGLKSMIFINNTCFQVNPQSIYKLQDGLRSHRVGIDYRIAIFEGLADIFDDSISKTERSEIWEVILGWKLELASVISILHEQHTALQESELTL